MRVNLSNRQGGNILIPQPGEIWEVNRIVQSPLEFSSQEQQKLYSASVQSFLAGKSPPRYVMIVKEPVATVEKHEQWLIVSVMFLSVNTDFLSDVDLLIPATISGVEQDLLAETWHIIPALVCNLLHPVGKILSRQIYDLLLTVGDYNHGLVNELPKISEILSLGLTNSSLSTTNNSKIQDFHEQEKVWSDILTVPVAAYHTYLKSMKLANTVIDELLRLEQE